MHQIIIGRTESGKTTLGKIICRDWPGDVLVLDIMSDDWPGDNVQTYTDMERFLTVARSRENALLIVDESGYTVDRYDKEHHWLATQSRHNGHSAIFISQRYQQLPPIVRLQAGALYAFQTGVSDSKIVGEEFNYAPAPTVLPRLPQFHGVYLRSFKPSEFVRVNPKKLSINKIIFSDVPLALDKSDDDDI